MSRILVLLLVAACGVSEVPLRQTVTRPSGVVTQPNELGELPPGTLAVGDNVRMRKQGVLEPRQAFEEWEDSFSGGFVGDYAPKVWELAPNRVLGVVSINGASSNALRWRDTSNAYTIGLPGSAQFEPGKTHLTKVRDRWVLTNDYAPVVLDPEEFTGNFIARQAGLPPPAGIQVVSPAPASGEVIEDQNYTAWRAVFKKNTLTNYTFRGGVSGAFGWQNVGLAASAIPEVRVFWDSANTPVEAGDLIELYRVTQVSDPDLLGDRFRLSVSYELTSTDITNGWAAIDDVCTDDNLGADLYTVLEGPSKTNWMPPPSVDVVTYKDATFYTAPAAWHTRQFSVPYGWGGMSTSADIANGIGVKDKTGTWNSGVATITTASLSGLAVGMRINHGDFSDQTTILSITGSGPFTLNLSHAPGGSQVGASFQAIDMIEIDGFDLLASDYGQFLVELLQHAADGDIPVVAFPDRIINWGDIPSVARNISILLAIPVSGVGPFTIRATNGHLYSPPLPSMNETAEESTDDPRTNRVFYSKIAQPEAVPPDNSLNIGQGSILKLWATQDSLFAFCTDGIFRIDGDGDDWSAKPYDPDTILLSPDAIDSMDSVIYGWTTAGFIGLSDSAGIQKISSPLIGEDVRTLQTQFQEDSPGLPYNWGAQVACDKFRNEVWFNFNDLGSNTFVETWIWNTDTNAFFTQSGVSPTAITYSPSLRSILTADRNAVSGPGSLSVYADSAFMEPTVVFNPVYADDLGYLKQWLDVTLFMDTLTGSMTFTPQFDGTNYDAGYTITANSGPFEHVVAPLLGSAYNKLCKFGFSVDAGTPPSWQLKGLSYRYRVASETVRT